MKLVKKIVGGLLLLGGAAVLVGQLNAGTPIWPPPLPPPPPPVLIVGP